ncbi:MAG TPA: hypothetical protein VKZ98_02215 [Aquaticitalea sp.]|nr:hypothetical protein [Aquaticitalea sp.]
MKTLKTFFILICVFSLYACNSSNKGNTNGTGDAYDATTNTDTRNDNITRDINDTNRSIDNTLRDDRDPTQTETDYNLQRNQQMYTSLNMNQDQIDRYEADWNTAMDNWNKQNPQSTMNTQNRMDLQRTTLRPILDDTQYDNYGQWVSANPYRY